MLSENFIGWNRSQLIAEITRLRQQLETMHNRFDRYSDAAEEHWRNEEYERSKQGIYG